MPLIFFPTYWNGFQVNCRRAAAAAFQENVGRQGSFANGIDIVNSADYFSLSSRANSYLHVAVYIAQYNGYLYSFAEDLICTKIPHWVCYLICNITSFCFEYHIYRTLFSLTDGDWECSGIGILVHTLVLGTGYRSLTWLRSD